MLWDACIWLVKGMYKQGMLIGGVNQQVANGLR